MSFPAATCKPNGASFDLVATVHVGDEFGPETKITVSGRELRHWVLAAARYSDGFAEQLRRDLAQITPESPADPQTRS